MGAWSLYFLAKLALYAGEYIDLDWLLNLLFAAALAWPLQPRWLRTTRLLLALPVAVALLWLSAPQPVGPPLYDGNMGWVGPVTLALGAALWLMGVVWMLRIFRGPRDEPPAWRYRR